MWLFLLFAVVIYEMIVETKKENARQARVDRVMKQTGITADSYKPYKFDAEKWQADMDARFPTVALDRSKTRNPDDK